MDACSTGSNFAGAGAPPAPRWPRPRGAFPVPRSRSPRGAGRLASGPSSVHSSLGAPASPGARAPSGARSRALPLADPWGARPLLCPPGSRGSLTLNPLRLLPGSCTRAVRWVAAARAGRVRRSALRAHRSWPRSWDPGEQWTLTSFFQEPGEPGPRGVWMTREPEILATSTIPPIPIPVPSLAGLWEAGYWPHESQKLLVFRSEKTLRDIMPCGRCARVPLE